VAHFAPTPDPEAQFRGMSWLTPIVREVMADKAATQHKLKFFENAATPNMVVKLNLDDLEKMRAFIENFREQHESVDNAYKTIFLSAGADLTVVGSTLEQMEFKVTQGAGETRIAAAAGVPPVVVGLSEGLQAATYSNYGQARRRFADGTMRPLWGDIAGSLEQIMPAPSGSELWYDDRDIAALQEDKKDAAEVLNLKSSAINTLVTAGYTRQSVVAAVEAGDLEQLVEDPNSVSVQLQAGSKTPTPQNGKPAAMPALPPAK
jgi:phage portal protein BeeE